MTPDELGPYKVHPVASLFPLMEGEAYDELKQSIREHGQQEPIVVRDGVLIDGRNRLRVCIDLGIKPRVEAYALGIPVEDYILAENLFRRHLTDDQRIAIAAGALSIKEAEAAKKRKTEAGMRGKEGGRGHRKTLAANSTQGFRAPTAVQQIAKTVGVSEYAVRRAEAVKKHAPELFEELKKGTLPLKDAFKKAEERKPPRPSKPSRPPRPLTQTVLKKELPQDAGEKYMQLGRRVQYAIEDMRDFLKRCPPGQERNEMAGMLLEMGTNVVRIAEELISSTEDFRKRKENGNDQR